MQKSPVALILTLWIAGLLAAGQFAKISIPFDQIRAAYPGHGAALGFLVSLISLIGVIFGLLAGLVLGRSGFRTPLLIALGLGALMSAVQALLPSFPLFLLSRFIEGVSHLIIVVAAPSILAQVAAPSHRNFVMTLWSTFFAVSFAVFSWGLVPMVSGGLTPLFALHGGLMLCVCAAVFVLLPKDAIPQNSALPNVLRAHLQVYRSPYLAASAYGWFFYAASFVALVTVLPDFMPGYSRSLLSGILPLSSLMVSMTLGVYLLSRMSPLFVVVAGFSGCFVALTAFAFGLPPLMMIALMFGAMGLLQAGSFSLVPTLNSDPADRALANGAMAQMGNAGNLVGTPLVLMMIAGFGQVGMIAFGLIAFAGGAFCHIWCARLRNKTRK